MLLFNGLSNKLLDASAKQLLSYQRNFLPFACPKPFLAASMPPLQLSLIT
jgi:hypothetical protein